MQTQMQEVMQKFHEGKIATASGWPAEPPPDPDVCEEFFWIPDIPSRYLDAFSGEVALHSVDARLAEVIFGDAWGAVGRIMDGTFATFLAGIRATGVPGCTDLRAAIHIYGRILVGTASWLRWKIEASLTVDKKFRRDELEIQMYEAGDLSLPFWTELLHPQK